MLFYILLSFLILVCVLMVLVILAQRSEGGALGMGGGPSGFMTARGAGNFLTRTTWILAALFFGCAIALIVIGNIDRKAETMLFKPGATVPAAATTTTSSAPANANAGNPLGGAASQPAGQPARSSAPPAGGFAGAPDLGGLGQAPSAQSGQPAAPAASSKPAKK